MMYYLRWYRGYLFFLLGILATGCLFSWLLFSHSIDQWLLRWHQQRWANAQLTHYRYIFEQECYCPEEFTHPVIIEVKQGAPISVRYLDDGTPIPQTLLLDTRPLMICLHICTMRFSDPVVGST